MIKSALFACTALTLSLVPAGAFAQDSAPSTTSSGVLEAEAIVVTAQKREQILQNVPISISVVGGDQLVKQGATQLVDLSGYVPGLQVDSTGTPGQSTISVRGVAPVGPSQTVGIYLDDSPVGSSSFYARAVGLSLDLLPYDVQRIEILRGPQGTLYGASSIGGLLKYVTVSPDLNNVTGRVGVEGFDVAHGGDLGFAGQGIVSVPLVPGKLAVSGSFAYRKFPGYIDNVQTGAKDQNDYDQTGGRVSLLWQPDEAFTMRLSGIWQKIDAENNASVVQDLATGRRIGDRWSNNNYIDEPFDKDFEYYSAVMDYDFGAATLTSATSYSDTKTVVVQDASRVFGTLYPLLTGGAFDAGLAPFTNTLDLEKFTQELRLTSPGGGTFEWMVGGFYTYEKSGNLQVIRALDFDGNPLVGLDPVAIASLPSKYREYALFGNATYSFSEQFDITAGARWARNKQRFRQISSGAIVPTADDPGRSAESVFTYSISPQYHVSEDTMIYGRIASGYRPGGPNITFPGVVPTVSSDSLTSYEIGIKSNLPASGVSLELAAFYLDWKDIQLSVNFDGVTGLSNAGSARSLGLEGSLIWQPVEGLRLGVNGAYVDAKLTSEPPPSVGGADGDRLPRIPRFSGSFTADYAFPVGSNEASIGMGIRHSGGRLSLVESNPDTVRAKAYTAIDVNAQMTFDERWTLRVYARNLTDTRAALTRDLSTDGLGQPYQFSVTPLQPRTIGIAAEYAF